MIIGYTIFNILLIIMSYRVYKNILNPVSVYSLVWEIALFFHQSGLLVFYELTVLTWVVIIGAQLIFTAGCFIFYNIKLKEQKNIIINKAVEKKLLKRYIIITALASAVGIVGNVLLYARVYGLNLFSKLTQIYSDRVNNIVSIQTIPYLAAILLATIVLCGIYLRKYGFTIWIVISIVLVFLQELITGGRADLVIAAGLFVGAYIIADVESFSKLLKNKNLILMIGGLLMLFLFVALISNKRASGEELIYATELYHEVFGNNLLIYKLMLYVCGPIGTLNEFLKEPIFFFGKNSFLPIYNILGNMGLIERIPQYQSFYYTPYHCNVGSYVREFIEDFTITGAIISVFCFGALTSYSFKKSVKHKSVIFMLIYAMLFMAIAYSIFSWSFRSSNTWIAIVVGILCTYHIEIASKEVIKYD